MEETIQCRIHGAAADPVLVYLPGLHGDWTLTGPFRAALGDRARLVVFSYPRRTDWTLDDYAGAILVALEQNRIHHGWLLAESFSSQVGWALVRLMGELAGPASSPGKGAKAPSNFKIEGVIFVGGFIRHPFPIGVRLAHRASLAVPIRLLHWLCAAYGHWAKRRACECPGGLAEIDEFVERRSSEPDRAAITSRYLLIRDNDLRPVAQACRLPVYFLTGAFDPIVPWPLVFPWARRHCPGFRARRVLWRAGHNVLLDAGEECARQILEWTRRKG